MEIAANNDLMGASVSMVRQAIYKDADGRIHALQGMSRQPAMLGDIFGD